MKKRELDRIFAELEAESLIAESERIIISLLNSEDSYHIVLWLYRKEIDLVSVTKHAK